MKYFLLLLLSFNTYAQTSPSAPSEPLPLGPFCGTESHEEIDACSVDDKFSTLVSRLFPDLIYVSYDQYHMEDPCDPDTVDNPETEEVETCPVWDVKTGRFTYQDQVFDVDNLPTLSTYERYDALNKPALSVFESDLATWKQEEKDKLDFRISIKNIDRFRRRMVKCGYNQPNMALLKKELIEQMDTTRRDCLNSKTSELDSEDAASALKEAVRKDMAFAKEVELDFVMGLRQGPQNTAKNKRLLTKLKDLRGLLSVGDIDGAKEELASIQTDADFSQSSKDGLLSKINSYLGE